MAQDRSAMGTAPPPVNGDNFLSEKSQLLTTATDTNTPLASSRAESFHSAESSQETPASSAKTTDVETLVEQDPTFSFPTNGSPLKVPIPHPQTPPPGFPKLTPEQESKYAQVLAKVSTWETLPASTAKKAAQVPISDNERMWMTRECLLRYLRATKWNVANALARLQSTLSWRREYGADTFTFDYISPENETGKQVILGYDVDARPCLYLSPGKQNTDMSDRQIHHLCFMLDRTVDMMPAGQENACLIINFKGAKAGTMPTVGQARAVLNILQGHNPERLGRALISELPWYVNTFFKLISPFIDPVTREKMKFNPKTRDFVPPDRLWKQQDGDLNFEYDHKVYWKGLEELTTARRKAMKTRWENAGKKIGEYEMYLRGGDHPSLQQEIQAAVDASGASSQVDVVAEAVGDMSVK
ncbi:Phosphatidylinositol transfer protein (PITP) [Vermiconidia calcicola]|uniref:Phosphatidylinositol transfer protein (PITP) n=1 Tax=Vermiconidia calcicola TaxID=1690605 RepID=A0ACC3N1J9_9PEZI|nr:Phosphatidylinositol transfer protein (PITP) [Vermiconidia calcicola]